MHRKLIFSLALFVCIAGFYAHPLKAEESGESADKSSKNDKISLAEVEPALYYQMQRYPKFFGDENTIHGGFFGDPICWVTSAARVTFWSITVSTSM